MRELEEKASRGFAFSIRGLRYSDISQREKYADFRKDSDAGLRETLIGISSVTSDSQGKNRTTKFPHGFWDCLGQLRPLLLFTVTIR